MCLSISNSRVEWKVVFSVIAVLLVTEGLLRAVHTRLSHDLVHIQELPVKLERLSHGTGTRMLFLGNSLIREGIIIELFRREMAAFGPVTVEQAYPDDTAVLEWLNAYRHLVAKPGNQIDVLVVGFAENQLQDRAAIDVRRLAHNYAGWHSTAEIFREESFSFDQRIEFALARFWKSFANAERVQKRILDQLIPYYRTTASRVNNSFTPTALPAKVRAPTYRRLQKLIDAVHADRANLVVIAVPVGKAYAIDPRLLKLLESNQVSLIDARNIAGITANSFPDGYHMDEAAARLMTRLVVEQLSDQLSPDK